MQEQQKVETEPKKMTDHLPIKKYNAQEIAEAFANPVNNHSPIGIFYSAEEIETLLQKLAQPKILTKAIAAFTFGRKISLEELLNESKI